MNRRVLIGLIALVPAALNTAPAQASGLAVPVCTGDGQARSITLPLGPEPLPGGDRPGCCTKACHTGTRKKQSARKFDLGQ